MEGIDKINIWKLLLLVLALRHMVWGEAKLKRAHYLGAPHPVLLYPRNNLLFKFCLWMDKKIPPAVGD